MWTRLRKLIIRLLIAAGLALVLALAPLRLMGAPLWVTRWLVPLGIAVLICYMGATLFNTFFYDRYPR